MENDFRENGGISFLIINQGRLDLMAHIFKCADEWAEENGYKMFCGNTHDGQYELFGMTEEDFEVYYEKLNSEPNAQVSDTTTDDSSTKLANK